MSEANTGYFRSGLPYNQLGHGSKPLVVFQGLAFENRPQPRYMISMYDFLGEEYTVFAVLRKPELPQGYSLADMAEDYAAMIREEFGGPLDVIGVSTGGSIAQVFAADHPELIHRLIIHSSAYTLSEPARTLQMRVRELALARDWHAALSVMVEPLLFPPGTSKLVSRPLTWLVASVASLRPPADPSDLAVTVAAEDTFNFKHRLHEICMPALVVAGGRDPFYTEALFRETAAGIPNARLIIYPGMGHPAAGKQFAKDVLEFLRGDL